MMRIGHFSNQSKPKRSQSDFGRCLVRSIEATKIVVDYKCLERLSFLPCSMFRHNKHLTDQVVGNYDVMFQEVHKLLSPR